MRLAAAEALTGLAAGGASRSFETPEGVAVVVRLADLGRRATALLLDLLIIVAATVAALLCALALAPVIGSQLGMALFFLISMFLRTPYFLFFELRWQGQTPGKRRMGLRVVDRRGGALSVRALVARNLLREVEVFMPLAVLFTLPGQTGGAWVSLAALGWLGVLMLLPLFNRDRLRLGDMVGGTWVVSAKRRMLERDLAAGTRAFGGGTAAATTFRFDAAALDVYGIRELQVLEQVLRESSLESKRAVCERIRAKIGWRAPLAVADVDRFLADYYAALRGHLERLALFGERRADKFASARKRGRDGGHGPALGNNPRGPPDAWR